MGPVEFSKYHGLGNDFVIVEGSAGQISEGEVRKICHRRRGVGADGLIAVRLVERQPVCRVEMVIFNRDGSRPQMCGNGVRCVAAWAQRRWGGEDEIIVETDAGTRRCRIVAHQDSRWEVAVDMGRTAVDATESPLRVGGDQFDFVRVDVGNPHAVIFAQVDVDTVDRVGARANDDHRRFPEGVNVEFTQQGDHGFETVVYERGVGRTQACGTGACAVAAAAWATGRVDEDQTIGVQLPGGRLEIEQREDRITMTGEAVEVFSGRWGGSNGS